MILRAFAKVNLHLDIGPRRRDGYHSLKTIFQEISLHDSLRFSLKKDGISLSLQGEGWGEGLSTGPDNLIVRALEMLREELGINQGMSVHLVKRIPMGAGLGGGSSDAAAALWGGWLLWNGKKKKPRRIPLVLKRCARSLGADVSFFLRGGLAKATGIGEKLTPLKSGKKRWLVLVYPNVHVSTKTAYQLLDKSRAPSPFRERAGVRAFNSFEPIILRKFPEIARAKAALIDAGCTGVMMSGSGSTIFGFVRSTAHGNQVRRRLSKRWTSYLVSTR